MEAFFISFLLLYSLFKSKTSLGSETINKTQFLKDGETIMSSGGTYVLGFFSLNNSSTYYVGIWYKQIPIQTVVWVANRDTPLANTSSAVLKITPGGQLALLGDKNISVWYANMSRSVKNPVAELLDSGNLVVRDADDESPENFLWQSFDYPTDHYLPGMKLGRNMVSGHEVFITARKSEGDPASGKFTFHLDPSGYPQTIIKNGETKVFGSGPWNGLRFSGTPSVAKGADNPRGLFINKKEVYVWYNISKDTGLLRFVLTSNGVLKAMVWDNQIKKWASFLGVPSDDCDTYGLCGANSICNIGNYPTCGCLDRFLPDKNDSAQIWSQGCHRRNPLNCHDGSSSDVFLKYSGVKLPDTKYSWYNKTMILQECKETCLKNCSCTAYSTLNISNGENGCLLWSGDLIDVKWLSDNGQDIYIRLAYSEVPGPEKSSTHSSSKGKKVLILVLSLSLLIVVISAGSLSLWYFCKMRKTKQKLKKEFELPLFDSSTIARATHNFSAKNKLGQGGFGTVYKGVLEGRQEIAVKRLSKTSGQGLEEFRNEVICIAKLQHRNLVKLHGCCISGEEKMLIYEYMPNKSLDSFIFDETRKELLDWHKRFNIINGIARGLLYLHQDSRLRIIHRDLKASNILLDLDLNPKISDFGLARSVGGDETGDKTKRIAGTHGYISPEYALHGIFSVKSDVFSFGILALEIVSGRRNTDFSYEEDPYETLLGHAWKLNTEGRSIALVDEHIAESCDVAQVLRLIHVGLLCVQQNPEDRPTMSSVVQMLVSDASLPRAKEPGFFISRSAMNAESSVGTRATCSPNEVTMTSLVPR